MSIYNVPLKQFVDLSKIIYDENDTVEIFLVLNDYDEQLTRESLIEVIKEGINNLNYDGENENFITVYWFIKGVKSVPNPLDHLNPPKRYVDNDEDKAFINKQKDNTLFNELHN